MEFTSLPDNFSGCIPCALISFTPQLNSRLAQSFADGAANEILSNPRRLLHSTNSGVAAIRRRRTMGCINTKPKSVLETIKDNYDKQDHDEGTGNPAMDLSPISMEGGDQASTPTREKSTSITEYISDRIRGLSSPPAPAPAAEVYFTPPFLFVGRRFKKHHRNTLGRMLSSQGRVLKLTKEGALAWYKTISLTGIPDVTESSEKEDGIIEVSSIRRIDRGYKTAVFAATGVEGMSNLAFSIITSERTLDLEAESEQVRDEVRRTKEATRLLHHLTLTLTLAVVRGFGKASEARLEHGRYRAWRRYSGGSPVTRREDGQETRREGESLQRTLGREGEIAESKDV